MDIVTLFKSPNGGIIDSAKGAAAPAGSVKLGEFRRSTRALPLLGLFTAAANLVAAKDYSFTEIKRADSVAFGTGPRKADENLDTFITNAGRMPSDIAINLRRIKVRIGPEGGDLLPETLPARLQAWGHSAFLALRVDGMTFNLCPVFRALDNHNIVTAVNKTADNAANLHAEFQNGAGEGHLLSSPVALKPDSVIDVILKAPAGVATVAAAAVVPVRIYLEGTVYEQLRG